MPSIKFTLSEPASWNELSQLWDSLSAGKSNPKIDREEIRQVLGNRLKTRFLSTQEAEELGKKWFEIPYEERFSHSEFFQKWEFESWVDAIENAEILLERIERSKDEGKLIFKQLALPSGGIEALQFLIELFDGKVIDMDVYVLE